MILVDTSAMYAWTDAADRWHKVARSTLEMLSEDTESLVTHSYVVVEALALIHRRLGRKAALALDVDLKVFRVEWVDAALHAEAIEQWRDAGRRDVSFVDHVSFQLMRRLDVDTVFAFDEDFEREGFKLYQPRLDQSRD